MCSEEAETTLSLVASTDQPAAPEIRATSAHLIPESKANSRHNKKHGKKSILDRLVLMRLNKKLDSSYRRAAEESVQDNVEVKDEKRDSLEGSAPTKLGGKGALGGKNTFGKRNKRKRGKSCQGSIRNHVKSEPDSEEAETDDVRLKRSAAHEELITDSNYDWLVDDKGSVKAKKTDVDDKEIDSSKATQEDTVIGGRFQALNANPRVFKTSGKLFGMMSKMEDRKRYTCGDCGRCFNQLRVLTVHQQMHTVRRNPLKTNKEKISREHMSKAPEQKKQDELCMHVAAESSCNKNELCVEEEKETTLFRNYLQEVSEQHVKGANHVKASPKKRKKLHHEEPCSDQKGYVCDACGKVFSLPSFLRRHQVVHTGEKAFACKLCGKRFGQKASQQRHEQTHGRTRPYMCNECGDGFSSSKRLERHAIENHQGSNKKPDLPSIKIILKFSKSEKIKVISKEESKNSDCSADEDKKEVPDTNSEQTSQVLQSKEPKEYTCHVCEKTFHQRSHLLRHSLSHTGEKPFKCKECGKGFTQKSTCLRHERTHSGELPFICTECGNSFAQKSGLQKHRLIHTGEKPYKCHFCECRFTQKTTCQRHERIHTGEKPYMCQQCGKAFGQSTSLERHVKTHLKVKPLDEEEKV